jgi:hypothetical protein
LPNIGADLCFSRRTTVQLFSTDLVEQALLAGVQLRLITTESEKARWDKTREEKHCLGSARMVGEQLRYVADAAGVQTAAPDSNPWPPGSRMVTVTPDTSTSSPARMAILSPMK